jgi:hypothetical protein
MFVPFAGGHYTQSLRAVTSHNILWISATVLPSLTKNLTEVLCSFTDMTKQNHTIIQMV